MSRGEDGRIASNYGCDKDTEQSVENSGKENYQQQAQSENTVEEPEHAVSKPDNSTDTVGENVESKKMWWYNL